MLVTASFLPSKFCFYLLHLFNIAWLGTKYFNTPLNVVNQITKTGANIYDYIFFSFLLTSQFTFQKLNLTYIFIYNV